jgi:hypothetical protein
LAGPGENKKLAFLGFGASQPDAIPARSAAGISSQFAVLSPRPSKMLALASIRIRKNHDDRKVRGTG